MQSSSTSNSYARINETVDIALVDGGILITNTTDAVNEKFEEIFVKTPTSASRLNKAASARTSRRVQRFVPYDLMQRLRRGERVVLYASTMVTRSQAFGEHAASGSE